MYYITARTTPTDKPGDWFVRRVGFGGGSTKRKRIVKKKEKPPLAPRSEELKRLCEVRREKRKRGKPIIHPPPSKERERYDDERAV